MKQFRRNTGVVAGVLLVAGLGVSGCGWFGSATRQDVAEINRPKLAILKFGLRVEITKLSSVQTVNGDLTPEQEADMIARAKQEIPEQARRMVTEKLAKDRQFTLIPAEDTDAAVEGLGLEPGAPMTPEQLEVLRKRLGADMVVSGTIHDYGKIRWQWMAAGMFGDMTWESVVIGLASAWNPAIILGNVGFELLTSTPVWFGGGYLFGVAFSPVRVEAWATATASGEKVWEGEEMAVYVWRRLKDIPEVDRKKKEVHLRLNLEKAVDGLVESLLDEELTKQSLRSRQLPPQDLVAF
jgi:hypothetical protein